MKHSIPFIAFLVPFFVLLLGFRLVVFDEGFYKSEFEKYDVYDRFDKAVADPAVENLIDYMKYGVPLSDFFNEKEKAHMVDVRGIIQKLLLSLYVLLFIIVLTFFLSKKYAFRSFSYGGVFALIIIFSFFVLSCIQFDFVFYKFHELSFNNDLWNLNPETDNLKALLPDGFFYDALVRISLISSVVSVVLMFAGFFGGKLLNTSKGHSKTEKNG